MTIELTSPSRVIASLTLMPVLSIWLVYLKKLRIEQTSIWFKLQRKSVSKIYSSCSTYLLLSITTAENQKSLDVDKHDYFSSSEHDRFENPTLFKSFPMRFDKTV